MKPSASATTCAPPKTSTIRPSTAPKLTSSSTFPRVVSNNRRAPHAGQPTSTARKSADEHRKQVGGRDARDDRREQAHDDVREKGVPPEPDDRDRERSDHGGSDQNGADPQKRGNPPAPIPRKAAIPSESGHPQKSGDPQKNGDRQCQICRRLGGEQGFLVRHRCSGRPESRPNFPEEPGCRLECRSRSGCPTRRADARHAERMPDTPKGPGASAGAFRVERVSDRRNGAC